MLTVLTLNRTLYLHINCLLPHSSKSYVLAAAVSMMLANTVHMYSTLLDFVINYTAVHNTETLAHKKRDYCHRGLKRKLHAGVV